MVIAHHIILTGYGHWLSNDPRGSLSCELRSAGLGSLGAIQFGRQEKQPSREALRSFHDAARAKLKHEAIWLDAAKRQAVAEAFGRIVDERGYTCFACAVLSNHAHLLIRKHREKAEAMIDALQAESAMAVRASEDVADDHPIWSRDLYKQFVDNAEAVERTIEYIQENPAKSRLPAQVYDFAKPYTGEWSGKRRPPRR